MSTVSRVSEASCGRVMVMGKESKGRLVTGWGGGAADQAEEKDEQSG